MKRTPLRPGTPPARHTRLKAKGRSRFPKRRQLDFMAWCMERIRSQLVPCHCGCGRRATQRSHRRSRGAAGVDLGNVNLLAERCHRRIHDIGERAFEAERGIVGRLQAEAARLAAQWEANRDE